MVSAPNSTLTTALTQVARELNAARRGEDPIQTLVDTAARSLPDINHIGITVAHQDGRWETRAASDQFVWDLDTIQYHLREGPCLHAIESGTAVQVEHAEAEERWPRFMPIAVARGLRAQLGVRLNTSDKIRAGLNMYSTSSHTISEDTRHLAQVFAAYASMALRYTDREDQLHTAIGSRQLIGQATGIVMERYQLNESRAFEYLVRVSSHSNRKLRDIAQEVVGQAGTSVDTV